MCGIAGILFSDDNSDTLLMRVDRMKNSLIHRGPDEQNTVHLNQAAITHTRLVHLDINGGKQPFSDNSGRYWLTYNGELYNYLELKNQLKKNYQFQTRSDTEVIMAAYLHWGSRCVEYFDGMFAFLIWDNINLTGFAARDPLGVKPFVYCKSSREFIFASETKAILKVIKSRLKINQIALAEYITIPCLSGVRHSLFENVNHLGAGQTLTINKDKIRVNSYYDYKVCQETKSSFNDCKNNLYNALTSSVNSTLRADVPIGSFLSGGLDSSILTILATRAESKPVQAFTIRFDNHDNINFDNSSIVISDDKPYVEELNDQLPIQLHRVNTSLNDLTEALPDLAATNDRLPVWEQELSQYFLSKTAQNHVKTIIVGDAADETHFGYFFLLNNQINHGPLGLMSVFDAETRSQCLSSEIQRNLSPINYFNNEFRQLVENAGYRFNGNHEDRVAAMTYLIVKLWLGRLLHNGDIHTMRFSVEARVPFANRAVINAASLIPPQFGYNNDTEKYCLREAFKDILPESIYRRKKSALPCDPRLGKIYQKKLKTLIKEEQDFIEEYLNQNFISILCNKPQLTENERILLFNLISLLNWKRYYL